MTWKAIAYPAPFLSSFTGDTGVEKPFKAQFFHPWLSFQQMGVTLTMAHRWSALVSLSPCIHPSTLGGWVKAQEEERASGTDSSLSTLCLLNLPGLKDKGSLVTCSLIILPTSELTSALSEPMHEPSLPFQTLNYPAGLSNPGKTWLSELQGLTLRAAGGRKQTETVRSRTTWGCVILEHRGVLRVGAQASRPTECSAVDSHSE